MSKIASRTMANKIIINAYSTKLCPLRLDGKRDIGDPFLGVVTIDRKGWT